MSVLVKSLSYAILLGLSSAAVAQAPLSLEQAVILAQNADPWLSGSRYRQQVARSEAVAAGELPDPTMSLEFANLPLRSLDFNQEPMTQFKVGVIQVFPRGDSRELKRRQLNELSDQHPIMRRDREAKVAVTVATLWLDTYKSREAIRLIEEDRALFEHLVDVAESNYTSAFGGTRQQDLVRAQLELTRLEDRLTILRQRQEDSRARLGEWFGDSGPGPFLLTDTLPELVLADPDMKTEGSLSPERVGAALLSHPAMQSLEQEITASETGVELARQQYKPQWGLSASYGYRDDDPMGAGRSDFFSVGVSFDLPVFTERRQDKNLQAAVARREALKTSKALALRAMLASFNSAQVRLRRLSERKALYENRLLREIHNQAEASLTAYTNDTGDFAEVVRARIAELNANIDYLNITVDRLKTIAELNYFFVTADDEAGKGTSS